MERLAGLGHALHRLDEHVRRLAALGVSEVEAVRNCQRSTARAGDVARCLGDSLPSTTSRIEPRATTTAVECRRNRSLGARQPHDASVGARADHSASTHNLVVLLENRGFGGDVRRAE